MLDAADLVPKDAYTANAAQVTTSQAGHTQLACGELHEA